MDCAKWCLTALEHNRHMKSVLAVYIQNTPKQQMIRIVSKYVLPPNLSSCYLQLANNLSKQASSKNTRAKVELKSIKMTYKISEHDLNIKVGQMSNWLKSKCEVKVAIAADGSPGSKIQADEIVKSIQAKIPESQTLQLVKKASGINFILRPAAASAQESNDNNQKNVERHVDRSHKIREELANELSDMMKDLEDTNKKT